MEDTMENREANAINSQTYSQEKQKLQERGAGFSPAMENCVHCRSYKLIFVGFETGSSPL